MSYTITSANYEVDTKFTFGKYKGMPLTYVLQKDPIYIQWCIHNVEHFTLSTAAQSSCQKFFNRNIRPKLKP